MYEFSPGGASSSVWVDLLVDIGVQEIPLDSQRGFAEVHLLRMGTGSGGMTIVSRMVFTNVFNFWSKNISNYKLFHWQKQ